MLLVVLEKFGMVYIFCATFFSLPLLAIGKRSTLPKIWGDAVTCEGHCVLWAILKKACPVKTNTSYIV